MIQILEYIAQNYTFLLSVLVLILLAIIGYYADKTNFGQGKNQEKETKETTEEPKTLNDVFNVSVSPEEKNITENIEPINVHEEKHDIINQEIVENNKEENKIENNVNDLKKDELTLKNEEQTRELEEIESLLPKKELINNELLNEIEEMEFNTIKEKRTFDVPNLEDISLPKIKNLVEKEQDIWKF